MNIYVIIVLAAFVAMSLIGFILMGIDKQKAKKGAWRISELGLFIPAILFGGVGSMLGMYVFRHKTKHWYFAVFFPLFAIIDVVALGFALYYLNV